MSKKYKSYSKEDKLSLLCDYYQSGLSKFSFMKLIVSTFLVYKVKKCLQKSGKVIRSKSQISPLTKV